MQRLVLGSVYVESQITLMDESLYSGCYPDVRGKNTNQLIREKLVVCSGEGINLLGSCDVHILNHEHLLPGVLCYPVYKAAPG